MTLQPFHTTKDGRVFAYLRNDDGELYKVEIIAKVEDELFMANHASWDNPSMVQSKDFYPHVYSNQFIN